MREYDLLEAARLHADCISSLKNQPEICSNSLIEFVDPSHLSLLRLSNRIHHRTYEMSKEIRRLYHGDVRMRVETAGRVIAPAMPVRLSGGITEMASFIDRAEKELTGFRQALEEVEAEAVAYVVGRNFGLDVDGSAFYLAAWSADATETIEARLARIDEAARTIIDAVDVS